MSNIDRRSILLTKDIQVDLDERVSYFFPAGTRFFQYSQSGNFCDGDMSYNYEIGGGIGVQLNKCEYTVENVYDRQVTAANRS